MSIIALKMLLESQLMKAVETLMLYGLRLVYLSNICQLSTVNCQLFIALVSDAAVPCRSKHLHLGDRT